MDMMLKTGNDMKCAYTGESSSVFITLKGDGGVEAGQLSESALTKALAMIRSYKAMVSAGSASVSTVEQPVSRAPVQMERLTQDPPALVQQFATAAAHLMDNPPEDQAGKSGGLAEIHIRELIGKWKTSFAHPKAAMAPVLMNVFGISKERIEILIG